MAARVLALTLTCLASVFLGGGLLLAQTPGYCDLNPSEAACQGGGSGGGPGDPGEPDPEPEQNYHWGGWIEVGTCVDDNPQILRYLLWSDGTYVRPWELTSVPPGSVLGVDRVFQLVCTDLPEDDLWDVLVEAIEALPPPVWESSPAEPGVTGLETWLWHSGTTTVGPVTTTWTHPPSGIAYSLEGRAWTGTITWRMGDGATVRADATGYATGAGLGGGETVPAARHTYQTSSASAGRPSGYPVNLTLRWVGEWRWSAGAGWSAWQPMTSTVEVDTTTSFEVVQIVGDLHP